MRFTLQRRLGALVAIVGLGVSTSAAASSADTSASADLDSLVAAAQAEGSVTIYSSQGLDQLNEFADLFEETYGIEVEAVRGLPQELSPAVEIEFETGNRTADVYVQTDLAWANAHTDYFVPPNGPAFSEPEFDREALLTEDGVFQAGAAILTIGWNTDRYDGEIASYSDLLDPSLDGGAIGIIDPIGSVHVDFYQYYLAAHAGEDYLAQLADLDPVIFPGALPITEALTSGEIAASLFVVPLTEQVAQGAPVAFTVPEPAWGSRYYGAVLRDSPHPNAAQLLANFMMTPEGQAVINRDFAAALPGIDGTLGDLSAVHVQDEAVLKPDALTEFQAEFDELFR